eukprot:TRINITY_DN5448_c0_g2_i1.p1 TRINITY_DN5448_c0_g2~~TRINITY_DN5448_c0_g2_i1.p1  ORF type:complete len:2132 (-),score=479.57 TRINITY_DN5448_c0_g2_i1:7-6402(-)
MKREITKNDSYRANQNLVIHGERKSKTSKEPTGEPESLKDKVLYEFGGLAERNSVPEEFKKKYGAKKRARAEEDYSYQSRKKARYQSGSVLEGGEAEGIKYYPRSRMTQNAYEKLLGFIIHYVGNQQQNVIKSAADEVLEVMKDEDIIPLEKKEMVENLLSETGERLDQEGYTELIKICNEITDYDDVDRADDEDDERGISIIMGGDEEDEDMYLPEIGQESEVSEDDGDETEMLGALEVSDKMEVERSSLDLDPNEIEAYWIQTQLSKYIDDADEAASKAEAVFALLADSSEFELENDLLELLGQEMFPLVKLILLNKVKIYYCVKLKMAASDDEREKIESEMSSNPDSAMVLAELKGINTDTGIETRMKQEARALQKLRSNETEAMKIVESGGMLAPSEYIDLDELSFKQGGHLMSNKRCKLPEGSYQNIHTGYQEVIIPAPVAPKFDQNEVLVKITELPEWSHAAFAGMESLNRIQSKVYHNAFIDGDNMLVCAPTGAGKTNIAMLTMLHEIGKHMDQKTGKIDYDAFKIVYIAPMKSLVQEMVHNFGERLKPYGIKVGELTGDSGMNKKQINETQLIFTTPEKWDVITRKSGERNYTQIVQLIIIDEIHLLHDTRGAVLEAVVARTFRQVESTQHHVRIVGLSATLPNYADVATFIRVKEENIFAFPGHYRPIPLQQTYIGVTAKRPFKRYQMMNKICYDKVIAEAGKNQILVFVHSRKETAKTARALRDMAFNQDTIGKFLEEDSISKEILMTEADNVNNADLKDLLPYGFGIHHAGMTKDDRTLVEDLMADKHVQVLVCTATLAWGVNLPAHTVIIKGTQVYSPEQSEWIELCPLDVMQMLGRAGRPAYDTSGDGIVITTKSELNYYLSLLNEQLPIESQFIQKLADNLNAEIVLGTVQNVKEAVNWLSYTYLYICMLRNPELYGTEMKENDQWMEQRRRDLIHSAATVLAKSNLIVYDRKSGNFQVTDLGKIASYYYITHHSMSVYNQNLKITSSDIDILTIFSHSEEFKYVGVRLDEKQELEKLLQRIPIPVKENIEEPAAKINVLLQAYISRLSLDGFSLISDMVYITQNATRLFRGLFEIALKRGWANVAEKCLNFANMVAQRQWGSQSPLRQFNALPKTVLRKLENKDLTYERLFDLDSHEIGEGIDVPSLGKSIYNLVHQFPRLEIHAASQPITRSLLKIELTLTPEFKFNPQYHGTGIAFWVFVVDVDGDHILHSEVFLLKDRFADTEHYLDFTVPLFEPMPPQYFVKVIADGWLGSATTLPISFRDLVLPRKYPPYTDLLDLQRLPITALKNEDFESLYQDRFELFNAIQTQVFNTLYHTDSNSLVCAPVGSGKTVCAELAMLRELSKEEPGTIVYIAPKKEILEEKFNDWSDRFSRIGKRIAILTGEWGTDSALLNSFDIVMSTPVNWDVISRRWKNRKKLQTISLYIFDELHLIGGEGGPVLEIIVSRARYISEQMQLQAKSSTPLTRIVGLSSSLANGKDLGDWVGATNQSLFNFHPNSRPVALEVHMQGFDSPHFMARINSMMKPMLYSVTQHANRDPLIIFVPSRKIARLVAKNLIIHCNVEQDQRRFLHCKDEEISQFLEHTRRSLAEALSYGVGYYHEALNSLEKEVVSQLFNSGAVQVLIATHSMCWNIQSNAKMVIIMGTQYYEGKEHRYVDYPISKVLQMIGKAGRQSIDDTSVCTFFGYGRKKEFYKKFIYEPMPVESHLGLHLHDLLNAEIVTKSISNKQDCIDYITWTFYYRRLSRNPNYYNLKNVDSQYLSDHLSELVEDTLDDLEQSRCISIQNDFDLTALNLGMIGAFYYVNYTTIELFNYSLESNTTMRGIIEILSNASEFDELTIRKGEDKTLSKIAAKLPLTIPKPDYNSTPTKVNILLQCHFERNSLSNELIEDQNSILEKAPRLLQAMVDVLTSSGWLEPAIAAMELSQLIVQGMWDNESHLKQLPHCTDELLERFKRLAPDCETLLDIPDLEEDQQAGIFEGIQQNQLNDIIRATNRYPNIELAYSIANVESITSEGEVTVYVELEREIEETGITPVVAPLYPIEKQEQWWLVVGDPKNNHSYTVKRLSLLKEVTRTKLVFDAPATPGKYEYMLYFVCDSYLGCDQEWELEFEVK